MQIKKTYINLFLLIFFVGQLSAQTDTAVISKDTIELSLSEAITKGLKNNYKLQIAKKDLEIAENNNAWGRAGRLPSINFSLSQNNIYANDPSTPPQTGRTETITNLLSPAVNLKWVLFNGFSIRTTKKKPGRITKNIRREPPNGY